MRFHSYLLLFFLLGMGNSIFAQYKIQDNQPNRFFDLSTNSIIKKKQLDLNISTLQSGQNSLMDHNFEELLKSKKSKYRFNLNLVQVADARYVNTGTDNLTLVRHGHQPFYHNPPIQYSLPEAVLISLAKKYLGNL